MFMQRFDLSGGWRYLPADSLDYARANCDCSDWPVMYILQNWFLTGLHHHSVVWFHMAFDFTYRQISDLTQMRLYHLALTLHTQDGRLLGENTCALNPNDHPREMRHAPAEIGGLRGRGAPCLIPAEIPASVPGTHVRVANAPLLSRS